MSSKYMGACHRKVSNKVSQWFIGWYKAADSPSLPLHMSADVIDNWPQLTLLQSNPTCSSSGMENAEQWLPWEIMRTKNNHYITFTTPGELEKCGTVLFRKWDMLPSKPIRSKCRNYQVPLALSVSCTWPYRHGWQYCREISLSQRSSDRASSELGAKLVAESGQTPKAESICEHHHIPWSLQRVNWGQPGHQLKGALGHPCVSVISFSQIPIASPYCTVPDVDAFFHFGWNNPFEIVQMFSLKV